MQQIADRRRDHQPTRQQHVRSIVVALHSKITQHTCLKFCLPLPIPSHSLSDIRSSKNHGSSPGLNGEGDALSRLEIATTLLCATRHFYHLQTCRACQLPYGLLSCISRLLSSPKIAAPSAGEMTELLTAEPIIFDIGVLSPVCQTGLY
jgi:hypothetical protein